jgi:threonylcarbamoyladenosine tRNA methylthiotransferase MtaB
MSRVEKIRSFFPDFNLTTDILVGFPGETEKEFQETARIARDAAFSHIHTFKFSTRKGTRAERMKDQVPEPIKQERSEVIRKISDENKFAYRNSFIGKTQDVLIEKVNGSIGNGYGEHYIPVEFDPLGKRNNDMVTVRLDGIDIKEEPVLTGKIIV